MNQEHPGQTYQNRCHMDLGLFIQGIIIGLTLAVPVGPISLVCIHRTVANGRLHGIISGLGVATADSFYAAVAFLGLTAVSGLIIGNQSLFRFLAGIALILVGIQSVSTGLLAEMITKSQLGTTQYPTRSMLK